MGLSLSNQKFIYLLERYVREAVAEFQRRIRSNGLVLSGEMLDGFRIRAMQAAPNYISQMIETAGYFRIKDLRSMHYARMPPQAAMEYYVEKIGVHKFAYVPGYEGKWPSSDTIAVERIAWGLRHERKLKPDVKRGYRGIYNEVLKGTMIALNSQVAQAGARFAISEITSILEAN
ncbi:hypothetical protein BWI93_10275 [Siphonobacter sp. BAB-5385]|uniref:hypothetical protein n=1 Tax=Siphonobacter sp. BAB-5385 TaxID=1864822 RepID=UPI000B9EC594|nr:hypothetical protein [Siphonobacter sp. BAB-5385]OZI08244.1 hypothetical protein BWI93_10275 [Siphonobacter sp. BAB-5385]